jgi:hypothetical protein
MRSPSVVAEVVAPDLIAHQVDRSLVVLREPAELDRGALDNRIVTDSPGACSAEAAARLGVAAVPVEVVAVELAVGGPAVGLAALDVELVVVRLEPDRDVGVAGVVAIAAGPVRS